MPSQRAPAPRRILLTQLRRIGDVLMTTPAVRAVREAWPEAHVVYLTEPPSDQLFRHSPHVDEIWTVPAQPTLRELASLVGRLRRPGFDVAIDFFSHPRSALLTRLSGAPRRIGVSLRGRRWAYTDPVPKPRGRPYAAQHKAALLAPLGLEPAGVTPELWLGGAERAYARDQLEALGVGAGDFLVALLPVSRQPYKVWPVERWARLADTLVERLGARVLPLWGPGEEHFVESLRAGMRHAPLAPYPMPGLLEMAALLERADLYVGNDAGPRHFAIAVGTPTVGVFGRPRPESWTPPGASRHRVVAYDPGCKARCTYPDCGLECIRDVRYEDVLAATTALIQELHAGRFPPA